MNGATRAVLLAFLFVSAGLVVWRTCKAMAREDRPRSFERNLDRGPVR